MNIDLLELGKQKNFCILPFIAIQTYLIDGKIGLSPCCKMHSLTFLDPEDPAHESKIEEYLNHPILTSVREDFLNGKIHKLCTNCFLGADNVLYPREKYNNFENLVTNMGVNPIIDTEKPEVKVLNLASSNVCNLRCRMCSGHNSTLIQKALEPEKKVIKIESKSVLSKFDVVNNSLLSGIEGVIITGGEPLLDEDNLKYIEAAVAQGAKMISMSSNLMVDKYNFIDKMNELGKKIHINLTVSVDGGKELNEYVRNNLQHQKVKENLNRLRDAENVHVFLAFTCSAYNFHGATDFLKFGLENLGKRFKARISVVEYPTHLNFKSLPIKVREILYTRTKAELSEINPDDFLYPDNIRAFISTVIAYMEESKNAPFDLERFNRFKGYSKMLDSTYGTNILSVIPELEEYW